MSTTPPIDEAVAFQREVRKPAKNTKYNPENPETLVHKHTTVTTINESDKKKFFKQQGVSNEVIDKLNSLEEAWIGASAQLASEDLSAGLTDALNDKEFMGAKGLRYMKSSVKTATANGNQTVSVSAYDSNPSPRDRSVVVETFGRTSVNTKVTCPFSKELSAGISSDIEKLIRGSGKF